MKELLLLMGGFGLWADGRLEGGAGCCLRVELECWAGVAMRFSYCFMSSIFCLRRVILLRLEFIRIVLIKIMTEILIFIHLTHPFVPFIQCSPLPSCNQGYQDGHLFLFIVISLSICSIMRDNNTLKPAILLYCLCIAVVTATSKKQTELQDLDSILFHQESELNFLSIEVAHHPIKLQANLLPAKTWLKEALCKQCDEGTGQCELSCFVEDQPKLSCDTAFCKKLQEFKAEDGDMQGRSAEIFAKIGTKQVLIELVLATKLFTKHEEVGGFNILDADSSFPNAFLVKNPRGALQLQNRDHLNATQLSKYRQESGAAINISVAKPFDLSFLKAESISIRHVEPEKYKDISIPIDEVPLQFSLQTAGIDLPTKLFRHLEKELLELYFPTQSCKLSARKLKCKEEIHLQKLYESLLDIHIDKHVFSLPVHLLFTSCSKKQCNLLLGVHNDSMITLGTAFWEIYNLEYSLTQGFAAFHRRNNQWTTLMDSQDQIKPQKIGFFWTLLHLTYLTFAFLLKAALILGGLSLIANCVVHWRGVLGWIRSVLLRIKARKGAGLSQTEQEQQHQIGRRRISRLPDYMEDSEHL